MAACVGGQAVQIVRMMERERERERARRELAERGERSFPRTGARIFLALTIYTYDTFRLNTGYSILITVDGSIDHPSAQ
jgi:hypothetical protein